MMLLKKLVLYIWLKLNPVKKQSVFESNIEAIIKKIDHNLKGK